MVERRHFPIEEYKTSEGETHYKITATRLNPVIIEDDRVRQGLVSLPLDRCVITPHDRGSVSLITAEKPNENRVGAVLQAARRFLTEVIRR